MLRFGIVGCGGISNLHVECLVHLEKQGLAKLVAGAETHAERREAWAAKYKVPVEPTLDLLLKRNDIDAVIVTSPSGLHGEMCVQIAKSGRHVLCEKPMDLRVEQVDAAIDAARSAGVTLGGIFQQRFSPGPLKVKRAIELGYFGQIVYVHCETPWYRTQEYYDSGDWRGTWALDGGVLSNQSPHMIDRLLWLGGDATEALHAVCECGFHRKMEAETLAVATLRLNSGALATVTGTTLAYGGLAQRVLICGTEGSASFSGDDLVEFKTSKPFTEDGHYQHLLTTTEVSSAAQERGSQPLAMAIDCHLRNVRDFVLAVRDKRAPFVTGEDQRKMVRALNLIWQRAGVGDYAASR